MPGDGGDRRLASALFRARLIDEPTLRAALAGCTPGTLGERLIAAGRVRPEDVRRALESSAASSSGAFAALGPGPEPETVAATVISPPSPPSGSRPPARLSGSSLDALIGA